MYKKTYGHAKNIKQICYSRFSFADLYLQFNVKPPVFPATFFADTTAISNKSKHAAAAVASQSPFGNRKQVVAAAAATTAWVCTRSTSSRDWFASRRRRRRMQGGNSVPRAAICSCRYHRPYDAGILYPPPTHLMTSIILQWCSFSRRKKNIM